MIDFEIGFFLGLIFLLAIVHTLGDVIFKKVSTFLLKLDRPFLTEFSKLKVYILPIFIFGISICISLSVRIIYGILLGTNPLSVTAGSFLGSIAIFSIVFGKIFFHENFSRYQVLGIVLIVSGIVLLV